MARQSPRKPSIDRERLAPYLIVLSSPILLTIYYYHGHANRFLDVFPRFQGHSLVEFYQVIFQFISFFLLCFVIPAVFTRLYLNRPLRDFGLRLGEFRQGVIFAMVVIPLVVAPLAYIASRMPDVRAEYPLAKILLSRSDLIVWYELCYVVFYYIAWEFYFRGVLLFGLREPLGDFMAILVQTVPSSLIHLGKPEGEALGSILAGLVFGLVALRTRSIWYVFMVHAALGVLTDLFIIFM